METPSRNCKECLYDTTVKIRFFLLAFCVCMFRRHIVKEKGFPLIESLMFEEHDMIKRAATECMCNMVLCEEVRLLNNLCT